MTSLHRAASRIFFSASLLLLTAGLFAAEGDARRFTFGANQPGSIPATAIYSADRGFGFLPSATLTSSADGVSSEQPFLFSVRVAEGNYLVTFKLRAYAVESVVTVKAEARRLMLENVRIAPGETVERTFAVNVRTPEIPGGSRVRLKQRELDAEMITWDDQLTLEFLGTSPSVQSLEIRPASVPTVFIAGDSTVCDQPREPWNSWGQMLPRFFGPGVAVANYAQSGESIKSSLSARRFDKVFSQMKSNDWLLVQFGHNDMKDKATNALAVYKSNLKRIVGQTRAKGATPVLITSMERKSGLQHDTLAGYPDAVRAVAQEDSVALIDLHALSKVLYRALGTNLDLAFQDGTHHNNYGSYELARCVVAGIRAHQLGRARHLADDVGAFDPAHPDSLETFAVPASLARDTLKPEGN